MNFPPRNLPIKVAEPVEAPVLVVRQAHQPDGLVAELVEAPVEAAMFAIRKKMRIFAKF